MSSANSTIPLFEAKLRIARPTSSISSLIPFYKDGLGFHITSSFSQHNGFNGVILGHLSLPYHLEFTEEIGHDPGRAPTKDNLLVFYLPNEEDWKQAVKKLQSTGIESVQSYNPWWDADGNGKTFEDADGYRVVLWHGEWKK
jgi:hypothetical protein